MARQLLGQLIKLLVNGIQVYRRVFSARLETADAAGAPLAADGGGNPIKAAGYGALFVEEAIPAKRSVAYTVAAIHAQGGLCMVPHPMSMLSESLNHKDIAAIINSNEPDLYFDGIETINATIVGAISNRRAKKINMKYKLAETGSSDAHFLMTVGSALTRFPGRTADDLRRSILEGTTRAQNGTNVSLRKIGIRQIVKQQRKSGGFFVRGAFKNMTKWLP